MSLLRSALLPLMALALTAACGTTEPEIVPARLDGTWVSTVSGVSETTLVLGAAGDAALVEADLASESCLSGLGRWSESGTNLSLVLTPTGGVPDSDRRTYAYEAFPDSLVLERGGVRAVFLRRSVVRSCVDYGWGAWEGTLAASVDGLPRTFGRVQVTALITSGQLEISSLWAPCDTCATEGPELVLRIDGAPGPLQPGAFVVDNLPGATDTFFGFHHTHPGDADFLGFNTERLSPTGTFTLQTIGPERVRATFSFRGNPIVEGQEAPDGRTTILVTDGQVDLTYR